jgi:hypothetical protein
MILKAAEPLETVVQMRKYLTTFRCAEHFVCKIVWKLLLYHTFITLTADYCSK